MKIIFALAIGLICTAVAAVSIETAAAADDRQTLIQADRAVSAAGIFSGALDEKLLDPDLTWTDFSGKTRTKSEFVKDLKSGRNLPVGSAVASSRVATPQHGFLTTALYGPLGLVQENSAKLYILRIWIKRSEGWRLLVYQAVSIGAPAANGPETAACVNPCSTVPFQPQSEDERGVITAYQAVERAVTAHDSAAWAAHIADGFFAVTSNSDRPLNKAARMAGLDNQKVAGIAPFPLVSARMLQFSDAMVMISRQQPEHGLPLHVTRVWFKRSGQWLETYSYQTTIQGDGSTP